MTHFSNATKYLPAECNARVMVRTVTCGEWGGRDWLWPCVLREGESMKLYKPAKLGGGTDLASPEGIIAAFNDLGPEHLAGKLRAAAHTNDPDWSRNDHA